MEYLNLYKIDLKKFCLNSDAEIKIVCTQCWIFSLLSSLPNFLSFAVFLGGIIIIRYGFCLAVGHYRDRLRGVIVLQVGQNFLSFDWPW